jgi:hypothetical protein
LIKEDDVTVVHYRLAAPSILRCVDTVWLNTLLL